MTLEERAAEAAANATCTRCERPMMQRLLLAAEARMTVGTYRQVGQRGTVHFNLCRSCGHLFRLFLAGSEVL